MINLTYKSAYQYTKEEKEHLISLKKRKYGRFYQKPYGAANKMVWYDGEIKTKNIKHKISKNSLLNSKFRCCYCGKRLENSSKQIDHFIPNKAHPRYSFHPLNLLPSCSYCNSNAKGDYDPIITPHKKYNRIIFSIVHPIIDNPDNHFVYQMDGINFDLPNCSNKANELITILDWTSLEHQIDRAKQKTVEFFHPISNNDLIKLVNECATYQKK